MRAKCRVEKELPICVESIMETDDENLATPTIDTADPRRAKDLREQALPRWAKSSTDKADPNRVKLRILQELPSARKSKTERAEPNLAVPVILRPDPRRV